MKLSFVIPAHNEEALIGKCLKSVLKEIKANSYQTEVIVVNNASTDRTREAALHYRGVTVVEEPFKGLVQARRAGFVVSTGELIANVDADTILPRGWLQKVMNEFEKDNNLVALSGPYLYYDLDIIDRVLVKIFYAFGYLFYLLTHYVFGVGAMLQGGNFIVRRDALLKAGGYDITIAFYGEDTDIARRISKVGKVKWTWALPMYTTGRRLKEEGIVVSGVRYAANYFSTIFAGRPFTHTYTDIRSR